MKQQQIERLLRENPDLWKAGELSSMERESISTGYDALDDIMPGHGWPVNSLMELILPALGVGELTLLMPMLRNLSQKGYWIVWLAPPHVPYAPYLNEQGVILERMLVIPEHVPEKECLWAMEKLLHARSCGVVMHWPQKVSHNSLRRLQLAAEAGQSIGVVFRLQQSKASPAALRMKLEARPEGVQVEVIKARGGGRQRKVVVTL